MANPYIGNKYSWFQVSRGCRQGDPLSPYIFLLCALSMLIRNNKKHNGIKVNNIEFLMAKYPPVLFQKGQD